MAKKGNRRKGKLKKNNSKTGRNPRRKNNG